MILWTKRVNAASLDPGDLANSHSPYSYWFEIGAPSFLSQNETVIIRFITNDGLFPNFLVHNDPEGPHHDCNILKLVDFKATNIPYSWVEENYNQDYYIPNIKLLLASENFNSENQNYCIDNPYDVPYNLPNIFFHTAYMLIEKKDQVEYASLVTSCNTTLDITEFENECLSELTEFKNQLVLEERQRRANKYHSELISVDCTQNATEAFSQTFSKIPDHHFTLYYYDQVGNLVKTVPPSGVNPISDPRLFDRFGQWKGGSTLPSHTKASQYDYNSFNQIVQTMTPDAGLTSFHYDFLQRMRFSQNERQNDLLPKRYSYTLYDDLSRVVEVGEFEFNKPLDQLLDNIDNPSWPDDSFQKYDVVTTHYSDAPSFAPSGHNHGISRGRVTGSQRFNGSKSHDSPRNFSLYTYDIHGNVNKLSQGISGLSLNDLTHIHYDYDLISGNVHLLSFNPGKADQFFQRYQYDADNRIQRAFSSRDFFLWDEDARYFYYTHGPLARIEFGHNKVQGYDYTYTMQGWIKTANLPGPIHNASEEPGHDGHTVGSHKFMPMDASAFGLGYFNQDYLSIAGSTLHFDDHWSQLLDPSSFSGSPRNLYNGNISIMYTDHKGVLLGGNNRPLGNSAYSYEYDQLHRIKKATNFDVVFAGSDPIYTQHYLYDTEYTYNPDGNLMTLNRRGNDTMFPPMDNLTYTYANPNRPNQLTRVTDIAPAATYTTDIDGTHNYLYDPIGNLIQENDNGNTTFIQWDVYNKVSLVAASGHGTTTYTYDPQGHRTTKGHTSQSLTDIYLRDAQGNILSVYQRSLEGTFQKEISLYGSSRLGQRKIHRNIEARLNEDYRQSQREHTATHYELTNHLGNVLTTITGRKLGIDDGSGIASHYEPEVVMATDYFPFGQSMPGREYKNPDFASTNDYRYAFNGKELDKSGEWGSLSHYDYGERGCSSHRDGS